MIRLSISYFSRDIIPRRVCHNRQSDGSSYRPWKIVVSELIKGTLRNCMMNGDLHSHRRNWNVRPNIIGILLA